MHVVAAGARRSARRLSAVAGRLSDQLAGAVTDAISGEAGYTLSYYACGYEPSEAGVHIDKDLVAASATPLVLAILAEGDSYGYAILKRVRELSGGELEWTDGMLYPLLHRLRRLGYVTTEWRTSPEGRRRRKYYAMTDEGRVALAEQQRQWVTVTRALDDAWQAPGWLPTALGEA